MFSKPSKEKVDEAIEKLANLIARKYGLSEPAIITLTGIMPVAPIIRTQIFFSIFPYLPILDALPGVENSDTSAMSYLDILDKDENVKQLIRRIEEITKELKESKRQLEKEPQSSIVEQVKSLLRRLIT